MPKRTSEELECSYTPLPKPTQRCECGDFARPGHATCNGGRSAEEVKAECEQKAALKKQQEEEEAEEQRVIDALPNHSKCPCGSFARRWKSFEEFEWGCAAKDFQGAIKKYKKFIESVKKDPLCNSCQAKRARVESA